MTLRHFRILVAVCDTMNMTAAAEALYMSQSAVSQTVAELEQHYGIRIFERLSRRLYLTTAGEKLLGYARHMIRMNSDIEEEMKNMRESGLIRIGASVTIGAAILPGLVAEYGKINPSAAIEVYEDNTEQIQNRLLTDKADIGLVEGEITSPDIISVPFLDDELVLICAKNHRFADMPEVEPAELEVENFIIREQGSGTRRTFEDIMKAHQIAWKAGWTCTDTDTIKAAVKAGLGISVISARAAEKEAECGELILKTIREIRFLRTFKIAYHKNKYFTDQVKYFIDLCSEYDNRKAVIPFE